MCLKHRVCVNVTDSRGNRQAVLSGGRIRLPRRLLALLFGEFSEILVLTPGQSVEGIEIHESKGAG